MSSNIYRSLTDIQNQAELIISGSPNLSDIDSFQRYSDELKKYILKNSPSDAVVDRLESIPLIEGSSSTERKGILASILTGPFSFFFQEKNAIEQARVKVAEIKSIYGSVEFLMKSETGG